MNLLLDECVDQRLAHEILAHDIASHVVKTVPQMDWASIKNGSLLALAEREFDVFITVDRNLAFQQNIPKFNIAVIVLHAKTNRLSDLVVLIPALLEAAHAAKGRVTHIGN